MRHLFLFLIILTSNIYCYNNFQNESYYTIKKSTSAEIVIEHPYGKFTITDPLIIELLEHPMMERIKHIHQYGINYPVYIPYEYSRFDHCLGVYLLLIHFGASREEIIAGLLHDASHTIGSHVAEKLFNHRSIDSSYQDDIHEWYLYEWGIDALIEPYGLTVDAILAKNPVFKALDQPNGEICADRLDYNLIGGLKEGMLTSEDIHTILSDLHFENGCWYFTNATIAQRFALVALYHTEHIWGSPENNVLYFWFSQALQRALELDLITLDDIHFGIDQTVWEIVTESADPTIVANIASIRTYKSHFYVGDTQHYDAIMYGKFRGINPWVLTAHGLHRLTELAPQFATFYTTVKERLAQGWYIGFVD